MKILLIGPQGSGKSTQAELLAKDLELPKITLGDIFRQLSSEDSQEGSRIRQILTEGKLVDDQTAARVVKTKLDQEDYKNGFVIDGYPRTVEQTQIFDPKFDKVIYLNVPEDVVLDRLLKRGRMDDTEELIRQRLNLYYQQTETLLDYYRKQGILIEIDGMGSIEEVKSRIREKLQ